MQCVSDASLAEVIASNGVLAKARGIRRWQICPIDTLGIRIWFTNSLRGRILRSWLLLKRGSSGNVRMDLHPKVVQCLHLVVGD